MSQNRDLGYPQLVQQQAVRDLGNLHDIRCFRRDWRCGQMEIGQRIRVGLIEVRNILAQQFRPLEFCLAHAVDHRDSTS
jgi:hypothetical protein